MEAPDVVIVSRAVGGWQALVAGHGLVAARSLQALDTRMRRLIRSEPVNYQFRTGNEELDGLVRRLRITRAAAQRYEDKARQLVDQVVLLQPGLSQRDLGVLVGLSHQRVYQLRARQRQLSTQFGNDLGRERPNLTTTAEDQDVDPCDRAPGVV